jgi:hypothetical protein
MFIIGVGAMPADMKGNEAGAALVMSMGWGDVGPELANWFIEGALLLGLPVNERLSMFIFSPPTSLQVLPELAPPILCNQDTREITDTTYNVYTFTYTHTANRIKISILGEQTRRHTKCVCELERERARFISSDLYSTLPKMTRKTNVDCEKNTHTKTTKKMQIKGFVMERSLAMNTTSVHFYQ